MNEALAEHIDELIRQKRYRLVNSVVVYKDDRLEVENYYNNFFENSKNNIKSIWKSILSICAGICLDKGYIKSLDDQIANYIDEFSQNKHIYHKLITIRNLLTMTSGIYWNGGIHYHCPMIEQMFRSRDWLSYISDITMSDRPGDRFVYKEWDVILLSAVIRKASGMDVFKLCEEYLYKPLGIESGEWAKSPCGICYNIIEGKEEHSDLTAKDLAKLGSLFLDKGVYDKRRIISEGYVEQAISPSEQNRQYGLLWWIHDDVYGGMGYGGQEVRVWPEKRLISVVQATPTPRSKSYSDIFFDVIKKSY